MSRRRQLVFVTGEPGIGKTALVEAFLARIDRRRPCASVADSAWSSTAPARPICRCSRRWGAWAVSRAATRSCGSSSSTRRPGSSQLPSLLDDAGSGGRAAPRSRRDARAHAARARGRARRAHRRLAARPGPGGPALERLGHDRPARDARAPARAVPLAGARDLSACRRGRGRTSAEGGQAGAGAARPVRGGRARVPDRDGRVGVSLPPLCPGRVATGALAGAPSPDRRKSAVPREHDRRSDRPGAAP